MFPQVRDGKYYVVILPCQAKCFLVLHQSLFQHLKQQVSICVFSFGFTPQFCEWHISTSISGMALGFHFEVEAGHLDTVQEITNTTYQLDCKKSLSFLNIANLCWTHGHVAECPKSARNSVHFFKSLTLQHFRAILKLSFP